MIDFSNGYTGKWLEGEPLINGLPGNRARNDGNVILAYDGNGDQACISIRVLQHHLDRQRFGFRISSLIHDGIVDPIVADEARIGRVNQSVVRSGAQNRDGPASRLAHGSNGVNGASLRQDVVVGQNVQLVGRTATEHTEDVRICEYADHIHGHRRATGSTLAVGDGVLKVSRPMNPGLGV